VEVQRRRLKEERKELRRRWRALQYHHRLPRGSNQVNSSTCAHDK
jgi:hypothetical protein